MSDDRRQTAAANLQLKHVGRGIFLGYIVGTQLSRQKRRRSRVNKQRKGIATKVDDDNLPETDEGGTGIEEPLT